ncbi:MAG: isoprenylcysteine carboxylmethyltransferase family protein [Planctomycetes bacterium]|nr:isoprenylcysteine carboxylmethyltransferase family protein [Planctomycetota bacterium]
MFTRAIYFAYGTVCYVMFLAVFVYAVGFLGNAVVPRTINTGPSASLGMALAIDLALIALFGAQHSIMARPTFKRWWTKIVPQPIERSTYVFATNIVLALLFWQWRPMTGIVWNIESGPIRNAVWGLFIFGWALVFVSTLLLNHFELFGMRQVTLYLLGRPHTHLPFKVPMFYRHVRHPLYVGWIATFWATPTMTAGHLLFSAAMTVYILIAIRLEERNLLEIHGSDYASYRKRVPMLIPLPIRRATSEAAQ